MTLDNSFVFLFDNCKPETAQTLITNLFRAAITLKTQDFEPNDEMTYGIYKAMEVQVINSERGRK